MGQRISQRDRGRWWGKGETLPLKTLRQTLAGFAQPRRDATSAQWSRVLALGESFLRPIHQCDHQTMKQTADEVHYLQMTQIVAAGHDAIGNPARNGA